MYKIIKAETEALLTIAEGLNYINLADNGCFVLCDESDATGIAIDGTVYHILGRDKLTDDAEDIIILPFDTGGWAMTTNKALDDIDALNVDQEYRLTLIELGITDYNELTA